MRNFTFDRIAGWIVLALFGLVLILSLFVPIYVDEVSSRVATSQTLVDGLRVYSLYPQCGPESWPIPSPLIPAAVIDWVIYGHVTQPAFIRVIGTVSFIIWLCMLSWFALDADRKKSWSLSVVVQVVALTSLGVLPFLMVLNRGEQTLVLGLALFCLLPYAVRRYQPATSRAWIGLMVAYFITASYLLGIHPKALFFVPVMLASGLYLSAASGRRWFGIALMAGLAWLSYAGFAFWTTHWDCPNAPLFDAILKAQSLRIGDLFVAPGAFILAGLHNFDHSYVYIKNALFESRYQSDWLPTNYDSKLGWLSELCDVLISPIYVIVVLYVTYVLIRRGWLGFRAKRLDMDVVIPFTLFVGAVACGFFNVAKNFYESSLILPLLVLMFVLLKAQVRKPAKENRFTSIMFKVLLVVSILSQGDLLLIFVPYAAGTWHSGGRVAGQDLSISSFNYAKVRQDVKTAAGACGIKTAARNTHLVVDELTYFPFRNADRPYTISFITNVFGKDIGEGRLIHFLNARHSAGVITSCDKLPPSLRSVANETANYCCIGPQALVN